MLFRCRAGWGSLYPGIRAYSKVELHSRLWIMQAPQVLRAAFIWLQSLNMGSTTSSACISGSDRQAVSAIQRGGATAGSALATHPEQRCWLRACWRAWRRPSAWGPPAAPAAPAPARRLPSPPAAPHPLASSCSAGPTALMLWTSNTCIAKPKHNFSSPLSPCFPCTGLALV